MISMQHGRASRVRISGGHRPRITQASVAAGCIGACLLGYFHPAEAQPSASRPQYSLRIKSPFAGPLWRVGVDSQEKFVALSNDYKAAVIWAIDGPSRPEIARVPLRDEQRRRAHGIAMSPNGELVAYSVPPRLDGTGAFIQGTAVIYILRRSTGRIVKVLNRPADDIVTRPQGLRFSTDGSHLAAVLSSGCGLRVWATDSWQLIGHDDRGYGGGNTDSDRCCRKGAESECDALPDASDVLFLEPQAGRPWIVTSSDTGLRSYDRTSSNAARLGIQRRVFVPTARLGVERPGGLALSPNSAQIAVGDRRGRPRQAADSGPREIRLRIAIRNTMTLGVGRDYLDVADGVVWSGYLVERPELKDVGQSSLDRVVWTELNGQEYLFAAGYFPCEAAHPTLLMFDWTSRLESCVVRWTMGPGFDPRPRFIPMGTDRVMDLAGLAKRGGLLVASQRFIGVVDPSGARIKKGADELFFVHNGAADFRGSELDFKISPDARIVAFRTYTSLEKQPVTVTFDLNKLRVEAAQPDDRVTVAPDRDPNKSIVQDDREWRNDRQAPKILNVPIAGATVHRNEIFRTSVVHRGRHFVLLGSSESLRLISYAQGAPTELCREPIAEDAYRINITPDGTLAITGHSDGTLRWHRIAWLNDKCRLELLLSAYVSEVTPGNWSWSAWRPSGEFARDVAIRESMEWQRVTDDEEIVLTPFERLAELYDWDAITQALFAGPSHISLSTDSEQKLARSARVQLVTLLDEPPAKTASIERFPIRLKVAGIGGWPKNLIVAMENGTALAKTFQGITYRPWEPVVLNSSNLQEGVAELEIELPASARTTDEPTELCFYIDQVKNVCEEFRWTGDLAVPIRRRLWAIMVGVASHDERRLNLSFSDNDVLDLARLFVDDFETANASGGSTPPNFQEMKLDLILSPRTEEGSDEARVLEQGRPYVTVRRPPTKAAVMLALEEAVATRVNDRTLNDDLFLFYFSGHGATFGGKTVLALPQTHSSLDNWRETALVSTELLHLLRQIPGQKVAIFDACRTEVLPDSAAFDPGALRTEFDDKVLSAYFFFSGRKRESSIEVPGLTFNTARRFERQGNGLFTYAIIDALTNRGAGRRQEQGHLRIVHIEDVMEYLRNQFFSSTNRPMLLQRIPPERREKGIPMPQFYQARNPDSNKVMRAIGDEP